MPRMRDDDDEDAESGEDGGATIECPYCHKDIYDDSVQCPGCGNYISQEDLPAARRPWWIIVGVLAGLFAVYCWVAR